MLLQYLIAKENKLKTGFTVTGNWCCTERTAQRPTDVIKKPPISTSM